MLTWEVRDSPLTHLSQFSFTIKLDADSAKYGFVVSHKVEARNDAFSQMIVFTLFYTI